jgi:hypothetical protein
LLVPSTFVSLSVNFAEGIRGNPFKSPSIPLFIKGENSLPLFVESLPELTLGWPRGSPRESAREGRGEIFIRV